MKEVKAKGRDAITQTINDKRSISIQCDTPVAIGTVDVEVQCDLLFSPEKKFKKQRVLPKSEVEVKRDAKAEITIAQNSIPEAKFETSPTLFKDFLGTSSRRIRNRTVLLNEKKDIVVLGSGLETVQKRKLENAAATLNFKLASEWSPSVTHLVVSLASNVDKKEKLTIRSLKYLMALMSKYHHLSELFAFCQSFANELLLVLFQAISGSCRLTGFWFRKSIIDWSSRKSTRFEATEAARQ